MVDLVLTIFFHNLLGAFRIVANRVRIDYFSRSSDILNGLSLGITIAYGQISRGVFSRQATGFSNSCEAISPVADASFSDCGMSDARSKILYTVCFPHRSSFFLSYMRGCGMGLFVLGLL